MINCSIDCSLTVKHYVFEASFWLKDWRLTAETYSSGAIKVLHVGPVCISLTNMKKLKELYLSGEAEVITLEDLVDM